MDITKSTCGRILRPVLLLAGGFLLATTPATGQSDNISLSGRIGFRGEYIRNENFAENDATRDDDHRVRFRVRVRIAGEYSPSEQVTLGLRFSTGSTAYPSSGWSSMNDDFRRDQIALDRAYVHLNVSERFQLRFGFDENPLFRSTELVWDGDVQPGGMSEVLSLGNVELVAGQFVLREVRSSKPDREENSFLLAHGISYRTDAGGADLRVGAFHYYYTDADVLASALDKGTLDSDFKTNRFLPGDPTAYFSGYSILGGSVRYQRNDFTFAAEASVNLDANDASSLGAAFEDKESLGFAALVTYGRLRDPWDVNVTSGFFHIEADAVIAAFNSDDVQQTNLNTVPIWVRLRLPGGADLIWDTYIQSKIDESLASNGGIVHDENATKIRTRITLQARF